MSDPRIAIIGAGNLSSRRIYSNIGAAGGQIVGVCDLDGEKSERNARRFGGAPHTDFRAMIDARSLHLTERHNASADVFSEHNIL